MFEQEWTISSPFLAYELPDLNKICISNIIDRLVPQIEIDLDHCEFVKFVDHCRSDLEDVIKYGSQESSIVMLVKKAGKFKLLCFIWDATAKDKKPRL